MPYEPFPSLVYRQLRHRIRPARIATAIPVPDPHWEHTAFRMLENYSVTWGGIGNLSIPIRGDDVAHPAFWPLIELFDADLWATYIHTIRGLQLADPERYEQWLSTQVDQWVNEYGGTVEAATDRLTTDQTLDTWLSPGAIPEPLANAIKRRSGPAMQFGQLSISSYTAGDMSSSFVVNVFDIYPLPDRIYLFEYDDLPLPLGLLIATRFGALHPQHMRKLEAAGIDAEVISIEENSLDFILPLSWGIRPWPYGSHEGALMTAYRDSGESATKFTESGPFALSLAGCGRWRRGPSHKRTAVTVVVGTTANDYYYAQALEHCGVQAFWLPGGSALGDNDVDVRVRRILAECLGSALRDGRPREEDDDVLHICSLSLPHDEIVEASRRLQEASPGGVLSRLKAVSRAWLPEGRIPLIADVKHYDSYLEEPFKDDEMQRSVPVLLPSAIHAKDPWNIIWWVDVEDNTSRLPGRVALNELIVTGEETWTTIARSGKDGIAFFSRTQGFTPAGAALQQMAERPRLQFPSISKVFGHLFASEGYTVSESAAGRFRRLTIDLWGGIHQLYGDIADDGRFALLKTWLSKKDSGVDPGVYLRTRRYLSFEDAVNASGMEEPMTRVVLDHYLDRKIVRRGLILKCQHCLHFEWYPLDSIRQFFLCERCLTECMVTAGSWRCGNEPQYYYDLAEVATQALRHNVHVPVRALVRLSRNQRSFQEMSEVEVVKDGRSLEIDLLALVNGRIVIGEAKTTDFLKKGKQKERRWLQRYVTLAEDITADEVVFATTTQWCTRTKSHIDEAFQSSNVSVQVMENLGDSDG